MIASDNLFHVFSFEECVTLLRERDVIAKTKALLQRLHFISSCKHGPLPEFRRHAVVNARVFLSSFMIVGFPTSVFEYHGERETKLADSAGKLLGSFELLYNEIRNGDPNRPYDAYQSENARKFPAYLAAYLDDFKEWKVHDEEKLLGRISHALLALYRAEFSMTEDTPQDSPLRNEILDQIRRLRTKFHQINDVKLKEWDEKYPAGVRERANLEGNQTFGDANLSSHTNSLFAPCSRMSNEQLAYNLLLDPSYQLEDREGQIIAGQNPDECYGDLASTKIRNMFSDAFWDSLVFDMTLAKPCFARVRRVLAEVKDGLRDLARQELYPAVESLNLDDMNIRGEQRVLDSKYWINLFETFITLIGRVQAPARDEEFRKHRVNVATKLAEMGDPPNVAVIVEMCRTLLHCLNTMRLDAANARLRMISPVVQNHGMEYFRGKYSDMERAGKTNEQKNKNWLIFNIRSKLVSPNDPLEKIHAYAFLQLVFSPYQQTPLSMPDTALLDIRNINVARAHLLHVMNASCILCRLRHLKFGEEAREIATKMFVEEKNLLLSFEDLIEKLQNALKKEGSSGDASQLNHLKCFGGNDDPVRKLM